MVLRSGQACAQCRVGKRKCQRQDSPTGSCRQCVQRSLSCSMAAEPVNNNISYNAPRAATPLPPKLPRKCIDLVELYFKHIHDQPHSLFHEKSFKKGVLDGTVARHVLLAMMGLAARFSDDPEIASEGSAHAASAKKILAEDFGRATLENVQVAVLLGNIAMGESEPDAASLFFVLANRMAHILKLSDPNPSDDAITNEVRLRVWWSCFVIDTWSSCGSNLTRQFSFARYTRPRVPMDELTFYNMTCASSEPPTRRSGIWGHMVDLVEIYSRIQDFQKDLAATIVWDEDVIDDAVQRLGAELRRFERDLPPDVKYSQENLSRYISHGLGSTFLAFHLGLHHYHTLLYYLYLDRRRSPRRSSGIQFAETCKFHANAVCDILRVSRDHHECGLVYNIVGHVTIVSSSVLLHSYLFGEAEDLPQAKLQLESNFETLVLLRRYWPSVELMTNRLVMFQNNCLSSLTQDTYRFDRWMIKFLLEYSLALEEKLDEEPISWTSGRHGAADAIHFERSRVTESIITDRQ